jgi:diacylglycerol kinase (ATP)
MLVIINPTARLVERAVRIGDIVQHLLEAGANPRVALTREKGDAHRLAKEAAAGGYKRIVVAGGDGTVNEVIQAIAGTPLELAVIPVGTGNILARHLRLRPGELPEACRLAVAGEAQMIDLGVINDRYFVGMAGVGLDAEIVDHISIPWKEMVGWLAFAGQTVQAILTEEPKLLRLTFEQDSFAGLMWGVLISNLPEYAHRMALSRNARADDGLLEFVVLHDKGFGELLNFGFDTFVWGAPADQHHAATVVQAKYLLIESADAVKWQADGDIMGETPMECTIAPGALRLVSKPLHR